MRYLGQPSFQHVFNPKPLADPVFVAETTTLSDVHAGEYTSLYRVHVRDETILTTTYIPCHLWDLTASPEDLGELRYEKPDGSTGEIYSSVAIDSTLWLFAYSCGAMIFKWDGSSMEIVTFPGAYWNWRCRGIATNGETIWVCGEYEPAQFMIAIVDVATNAIDLRFDVGTAQFVALFYDADDDVLYGLEESSPMQVHQLDPSDLSINWSLPVSGGAGLSLAKRDGLIIAETTDPMTLSVIDPAGPAVLSTHVFAGVSAVGTLRNSLVWRGDQLWAMHDTALCTIEPDFSIVNRVRVPPFVNSVAAPPVFFQGSLYFGSNNGLYRTPY